MSKSKRESNHRKEERKFEDGDKQFIHEYREHKEEKYLKNVLRSNDLEALLEVEDYK